MERREKEQGRCLSDLLVKHWLFKGMNGKWIGEIHEAVVRCHGSVG